MVSDFGGGEGGGWFNNHNLNRNNPTSKTDALCYLRNRAEQGMLQLRPQGLLLVQNGGRRNPWPRLPRWLQTFVRILSCKQDEMSSLCFNNAFRLQKINRATRRCRKQLPKKPFHHVSRDKILHDSWSISADLARGFSDRHLNEEKALGTRLGMLYLPYTPFIRKLVRFDRFLLQS